MIQTFAEFMQAWILKRFEIEMPPTADFFESGVLDSLTFNEMLAAVESEFQIEVDFDSLDDWREIRSVDGLASFLGTDDLDS